MSSGTRAAQSAANCAQSAVGNVEIRRIWADSAAESGPEAKVGTVTGASFHPSYWSARYNGEHACASEANTARTDEDDKKSLRDTPGAYPRTWKQCSGSVEGRVDKRVDRGNPDSVEGNVDGHCGQEAADQAHDDASRAPPSPEAQPLSPVETRRVLEEAKLPALPGSVKDVSLAPVNAAHGQDAATSASGAAGHGNLTGDKGKGKQRAVTPAMIDLDDSDDEATLRNGQNAKGEGREESPDSSTPTSSNSSPLRSSPAQIKPLGPGWRGVLATVLRHKAQAPTYEIGPQSSSGFGLGSGFASPSPSANHQQQEGSSVGTPHLDAKAPAFIPSSLSTGLHSKDTSIGASTTKLNPQAAPFVPAAMRKQQASNDVPSDSETICPRNMPHLFDLPAMPPMTRLPRRRRMPAMPTVATPETSDTSDSSEVGQQTLVEAAQGDWRERLLSGLNLAPAMGTAPMGIAPMETTSNQSSIGDDSLPLDFNPESLLPDYYRRQAPRPLFNVQRYPAFGQPLQYGPQHHGPFRRAGNMWAPGPRSVGQHTQQEPQHRGANVWDPYPQYLTHYPEPPLGANASAAAPGLHGNIGDARVPPADAPYYGQGAMLPPPLDIPAAGLTPQDRLQLAASITAASSRAPPPPPSAYQAPRSPRQLPQNPFISESEILLRIQRFADDFEPELVAEMGGNYRQRFDAESRALLERVTSQVFREELMQRQQEILRDLEQQTPQQRAMWVRQDASANAGAGAGDAHEAAAENGPYEM